MPSHTKPELSVSALLRNLNEELGRKKVQTVDNGLVSKTQISVRHRLGGRANNQDVQISHARAKGELCGVIFMCNRRTWKECIGKSLFGLPIAKKSLVEQVVPGMKLFLFEYERRQLWGVFEAISYGGMDIIPDAYTGGSFPCQVRVKVPEDCVALYEKEFHHVIKGNYYSAKNFNFNLTRKQVCQLVNLFERKYLRLKEMEPGLIEYEDSQRIQWRPDPKGPLLLANESAHVYPEDLNMTSLAHNSYASRCQIVQDESFFDSEGVGFVYRDIENSTGRETKPFVPLSNTIVQNSVLPLNVDVTRFTNIGGQLGDFGTGDMIPVYSTVKQEIVETVVIPGHVSHLHSERPSKSVWSRISGRLMAAEPSSKPVKLSEIPAQPSPLKVFDESLVAEAASSPIQSIQYECIADVCEKAEEERPIGFKRRRASNNNASSNANEILTSKRRRKLTRPFFEASANETLAEQVMTIAEGSPCFDNIDLRQNKTPMEEQHLFKTTLCDVNISVACDMSVTMSSSCNEERIRTSCNSGDDAMQAENAPTNLDLNLPWESQTEGVVKLKQEANHYDNISVGKMKEAAACALTLSLCPQESEYALAQSEKEAELTSNSGNNSIALALVQDISMPHSAEVPETCVLSSKQVDKADAGLVAGSSRANTLSLAPCTPAKEVVDSSGPAMDKRQGSAVPSDDSMQEIPLKLDAILPDVEVQLDNNDSPLDSISLPNTVDLKSILSGLQVSGIKLQLGSSPCLILQLGDSSSSAGNEEMLTEISLKPHSSDADVHQRPSSS